MTEYEAPFQPAPVESTGPPPPRPVNGWRNYTHYRCPVCGHLEKQIRRDDDALPRAKEHIAGCAA